MSPMTPINPAMAPATPSAQAQTPQSQYLAAALKQLSAQAPATPAALGMNLGASGLMQMAQRQAANYGPTGANAQKNATSNALAASLAQAGIASQQSPALPTSAPMGGLMGLGTLFGGSGG